MSVEERKKELAAEREALGLLSSPFRTITLFLTAVVEFLSTTVASALLSRWALVLCYPALLLWMLTRFFYPEEYAPPHCSSGEGAGSLFYPQLYTYEAAWWLILGILSSIGFGTGLHSGIMFLWPFTMQLILKSEECGSTNFSTLYNQPCSLQCGPKNDGSYTFFNQLLMLLPSVVLWGVGTAIGELPPYFVTRAARRSGKEAVDYEEELAEARKSTDVVSKLKVYTIEFTKKAGFWGVLALASWPNAAFDMCGMACGFIDMPFWTFFIATALGKGSIKVTLQAIVCIAAFRRELFDSIVAALSTVDFFATWAVPQKLAAGRAMVMYKFALQTRVTATELLGGSQPLKREALRAMFCEAQTGWCDDPQRAAETNALVDRVLDERSHSVRGWLVASDLVGIQSRADGKLSLGSLDPGSGSVLSLGNVWNVFLASLVGYFMVSIVDQMAKAKQQELDEAEIARMQKAQ